MTSLRRKTVEREETVFPLLKIAVFLSLFRPLYEASAPSLNAAEASWARKRLQRQASHHVCISNPPGRRGTQSSELVCVHPPQASVCVSRWRKKCVRLSFLLLLLCWEGCGGRGCLCLHSSWPLLPPTGTVLPALSSVVGRCVCN